MGIFNAGPWYKPRIFSISSSCCSLISLFSIQVTWSPDPCMFVRLSTPPTPSLINKPPRRCLKVWLCSLPGPLRHRIQHSTAPYLVPHYASIFQRARGFPSGLRQPPVSAGSPAGPFPAIPTWLRITHSSNRNYSDGFTYPQGCRLCLVTRVRVIDRFVIMWGYVPIQ